MRTWKDRDGREWLVDVNVGSIRKVKAVTTIDLLSVVDGTLGEKLSDPMALCDVLWVLSEEQALKKNITPEVFGASLAGDSLESAVTALVEEIVDFFPQQRRKILKAILEKARASEKKALDKVMVKVESQEVQEAIDKVFAM